MFFYFFIKAILSCVWLGVAILCAHQFYKLWFGNTTVINPFSFTDAGVEKADEGKTFPTMVYEDYKRIRELIRKRGELKLEFKDDVPANSHHQPPGSAANRGQTVKPAGIAPPNQYTRSALREESVSVEPKVDGFKDLDIQFQGVNLTSILRFILSQADTSYQTINGQVCRISPSNYSTSVSLRRRGADVEGRFGIVQGEDYDSLQRASWATASHVYFMLQQQSHGAETESTSSDERNANVLRRVSANDFLLYLDALNNLVYYLEHRYLSAPDATKARDAFEKAEAISSSLVAKNPSFLLAIRLAMNVALADGNRVRHDCLKKKFDEKRVEAEVDSSPRTLPLSGRGKARPLRPGVSVSSVAGYTGSICCFVRDRKDDSDPTRKPKTYLLSTIETLSGVERTAVLQPGVYDWAEIIKKDDYLQTWDASDGLPVARVVHRPGPKAKVSGNAWRLAALAELAPSVDYDQDFAGTGPIQGIADAPPNLERKSRSSDGAPVKSSRPW